MTEHKYFTRVCTDGTEMEYGLTEVGDRIAFIKSGRGGNAIGYENKYVKMAEALAKEGYTVLRSPNPADCRVQEEGDLSVLKEFGDREISLFGASAGAFTVTALAGELPRVGSLVLVNAPLMVNYQRFIKRFAALENIRKVMVYGSLDPSIPYLKFIEVKHLPNTEIIRISGADHNFSGMVDRYIELYRLMIN